MSKRLMKELKELVEAKPKRTPVRSARKKRA